MSRRRGHGRGAAEPLRAPGQNIKADERIRVLRVIARLNMGGPAYHVSILSGRLDPSRFETLLAAGRVGPGEASASHLTAKYGARLLPLEGLQPEIHPLTDLCALLRLARLARRFRPHVVHTHTAKAGMVGRLAALALPCERPVVVHTYHGHVLEGYFGPAKNAVYRAIERLIGRVTDVLIGVSQATVDDLVRLDIAPRSKFRVVQLGLELDNFLELEPEDGHALRRELGVAEDEVLLTYVGRLAPIKRIELMIRGFALAHERAPSLALAVVGDGVQRAKAEALARSLGVGEAVRFLGYRSDLPGINAAGDIAVLTSDNEGTPVSLIEAAAAGRPAIATAVGGVADVVTPSTGILIRAGDEQALSTAIVELAGDPERRRLMGSAAREHVRERFTADRLLQDISELYEELLRS